MDVLSGRALSLSKLSAESASALPDSTSRPRVSTGDSFGDLVDREGHDEVWSILAVNKFDSDRKRMSILLRSPQELGGLPILFCKGADSSMLESGVCCSVPVLQESEGTGTHLTMGRPSVVTAGDRDVSALTTVSEKSESEAAENVDDDGWELAQMLGLQAHLGDFASEGLRTLVLGMRVLSESECEEWLKVYQEASVSLKDRDEMLTQAALKIEKNLHIVGATAIEDKLQKEVPETIATLGQAGIKLWVLTGDKRETAVEIGYSTHVLTPKMHLTQVADNGKLQVRTLMAMEFIRLVKMGKLPTYQKAAVDINSLSSKDRFRAFMFQLAKLRRSFSRSLLTCWASLLALFGMKGRSEKCKSSVRASEHAEKHILKDIERRRLVRQRAEKLIKAWLATDEGKAQSRRTGSRARKGDDNVEDDDDLSLVSEETPLVFNRASSAKTLLQGMRSSGGLSQSDVRKLSIAHLTAQQHGDGGGDDEPIVDEDTLSLDSFFPGGTDLKGDFDKRKRTLLERLFAVDKQVRKGQLGKHVKAGRLEAIAEDEPSSSQRSFPQAKSDGPRALVIEGAALKHMLGDPLLEEILFAVADQCQAVIACRASPKQKALLVNLVRHNVKPEPITLAIGDGANDVGMIQEAHVGIGISGKEGKQAVNASDFAIAQFRFLEELVLIHGRWDFFRLSTVVLFSFYKNAVMAGILITFTSRTLYSGTPLYDEWLIASLNFVAGMPIIILGLFDRCLSKSYVRAHPEVYKATRENELITVRTFLRWIILVVVHVSSLYFLTVPQQSFGGGITSAFIGLMRNEDLQRPGDGEGGDLKSVGTVTFTCMVFLLAYKVLYESRSLVHGRWPAFSCNKADTEGFMSRIAYTWIGIVLLSLGFYFVGVSFYQVIGRWSASQFSGFVDVFSHVLGTRSMSWILIAFVPISAMAIDVSGKVFSNMFYPTQTQIHLELESKSKIDARRRRRRQRRQDRRAQRGSDSNV